MTCLTWHHLHASHSQWLVSAFKRTSILSSTWRITLISHYTLIFRLAVTVNLPNRHQTQLLRASKIFRWTFQFLVNVNSNLHAAYVPTVLHPTKSHTIRTEFWCIHLSVSLTFVTGMGNRNRCMRCASHRSLSNGSGAAAHCPWVQIEFNLTCRVSDNA